MSIPQQGGGPIERREQLVDYLASGCKPRDQWRIGTEHEKFGFNKATLRPLPYEGACSVRAMLEGLRDGFGWDEIREGAHLIGLTKGLANVSLEPGGQLELSGAPLASIHQTCEETNQHLAEVKHVADRIGAGFLGLGASPIWSLDETPVMPKGRYDIMRAYMPKVGTRGLDMMFRTTTIQVNLDFGSEADMIQKLRVAVALQPVATALFASSPFINGAPNGMRSARSDVWLDVDTQRSGMIPFIFEDGFGFERWVDYALDTPMYFVYRDGRYLDASGQNFRDFLNGRLPALPGETPTLSDWADHLTTLFPEARIKKYIEMRGADGGPWRRICALPAFWVGLTYNQSALDAAWDLVKHWTADQRQAMRDAVAAQALNAPAPDGGTLRDLARRCLEISDAGLKARAAAGAIDRDESHFLNVLHEVVATGETLADELLRRYETDWAGDLTRIYADYAY